MLAQSDHIIGAPPLYKGSGPDDAIGDVSGKTAQFREGMIEELTLRAGVGYFLEVESSGGQFTVTGTRDGSGSYGFSPGATVVGHAWFRTAPEGAWQGWPVRTTRVDKQFDLSFYLGMVR